MLIMLIMLIDFSGKVLKAREMLIMLVMLIICPLHKNRENTGHRSEPSN